MSPSLRTRLSAAGLFVVAVGVFWWAHQQWLNLGQVSIATGQMPSARILLWMLTLVASGFGFGLALSWTRTHRTRGRPGILLTMAFVPFAVMYFFWTQVTLDWFPSLPEGLSTFIYTESTLLAAAMLLGILLSGLVGTNEPTDDAADGPEQLAFDVGDSDFDG